MFFCRRSAEDVPQGLHGAIGETMASVMDSSLSSPTSELMEDTRQVNRLGVIRSCWYGGVEALVAFTQIGAKWVVVRQPPPVRRGEGALASNPLFLLNFIGPRSLHPPPWRAPSQTRPRRNRARGSFRRLPLRCQNIQWGAVPSSALQTAARAA